MRRTSDSIALSHLKITREIAASEEARFNGQDYVCRNNGSPGNPPPHYGLQQYQTADGLLASCWLQIIIY